MKEILGKIYRKVTFNPQKFVKNHPLIEVDESAYLMSGIRFRINDTNKITIGKNSLIGAFFNFESKQGEVIIGDNTFIHEGAKLMARTKIEIGNYVMISWDCTIMDHTSHSTDYRDRAEDFDKLILSQSNNNHLLVDKCWDKVNTKPVIIKDHVWIGFGSVIIKGVTIGEGSIIGAQSVVREDVPPWSIVIGNPARVVKKLKEVSPKV